MAKNDGSAIAFLWPAVEVVVENGLYLLPTFFQHDARALLNDVALEDVSDREHAVAMHRRGGNPRQRHDVVMVREGAW